MGDGSPILSFPEPAAAEVSIVMPARGNYDLTIHALTAVRGTLGATPVEVIVVDDASQDATPDYLARVEGISVIRHETHLGYIGSCNDGIRAARAPFVLLLDNDTETRPGWLDSLHETIAGDETIGIVGPMLLFPDGLLQAAGGIVLGDGTLEGYGRGEPPDPPQFNYVRETDYAPGSCMLVRRGLLDRRGGLDEAFAPAYFEDVDLAFSARELGYRVVYQPASVVVHHEDGTSRTMPTHGTKRFDAVNGQRFAEKWRHELTRRRRSGAEPAVRARDPRRGPRVVAVDARVPAPDRDAGSARMSSLLELLTRLGCVVTFVPDTWDGRDPYTKRLEQLGIEVFHPRGTVTLAEHLRGLQPELCILSRPDPAWHHLRLVRQTAPAARVLYDSVDLHFLREERQGLLAGDAGVEVAAKAMREAELALVRSSDGAIAVSDLEAAILADAAPDVPVYVVPIVYPVRPEGPGFADRRDLLFVGAFGHQPNVDAVRFLASEILPEVRRHLPDARLLVAGSDPPAELRSLAGPGLELLGWVPDLAAVYGAVRLSVAPLRFGAGMKGKVIESFSFGVPVVTTPVGAEGIGVEDGVHALIADTPGGLAAAIARAYADPELWHRLSARGRRLFVDRYSPGALERRVRGIFEDQRVPLAR